MKDPTTSTVDEIVDQAKAILKKANNNEWSYGSMRQLVDWLCAYIVRLSNDVKGKAHETEQDAQEEINQWAKGVERFFPDDTVSQEPSQKEP